MANIKIENNTFWNNSSVFREYNDYASSEPDWDKLQEEIKELQRKIPKSSDLKGAATQLESGVKMRKLDVVKNVIRDFSVQFSSAAFANIASAGLLEFLQSLSTLH